ncbi:MAG: hypothetical protein AAF512_10285 [Pseudomonadota bacterium]
MAQELSNNEDNNQEDIFKLVLQSAQNFSETRLRLQYAYATNAGRGLVHFLHAYQISEGTPAPANIFQTFASRVLSSDPFLGFGEYVPQQRLILRFRNTAALEEGLRNGELVYIYELGRWRFVETNNIRLPEVAVAAAPPTPPSADSMVSAPLCDPNDPNVSCQTDGNVTSGLELALKPVDPSLFYLDTYYCMGVITNYCSVPQGYQATSSMLTDFEWCPAWHQLVQSP